MKYTRHDFSTGESIEEEIDDPGQMSPDLDEAIKRHQRNALLLASDYTQAADNPTGNAATWATYRQQLRDMTKDPDWPNVDFPEPPT